MHQQPAEVYSGNVLSMHCQGKRLPYGATSLQLMGPNWWPTNELDDEAKQLKSTLQTSRNSFREKQTCNFMVYGIWPWFILWHSATYCGKCATVLYDLFQMVGSCVNRWQQSRKNDGLSQFPATLRKRGKQLCASDHVVRRHGSIISLPLVSKQPCSGNNLVHPGSTIKWHYLLAKFGNYLLGLNQCAASGIHGTWTRS